MRITLTSWKALYAAVKKVTGDKYQAKQAVRHAINMKRALSDIS